MALDSPFQRSGNQSTALDFFFIIFNFFWGLKAKVQNFISRQTTNLELHLEANHFKSGRNGPWYFEVQNSNLKWTKVHMKLRLYSKSKKLSIIDTNFKGPEPLLRQTSYLKAHSFLDANKRWGRIKVRVGSKKLKLFVEIRPTGTMSKPLTTI
ncbi:hypothetical protein RclHR1_23200004 [Rhizophagus clarus]|uniref:Uncharacterized protein n=1 Tax=Rhizophagus clarus TaxID=94130 RepID=A0A2Z6RBF7_9GLOM|nr:hypothetical protein RclHR1_23200004 [Rhizophagus clarus]